MPTIVEVVRRTVVSSGVRAWVEKTIAEIGFVPNAVARSLR
jgi:DNA-binding LacI/PurR family transcriptional regulator